MLIIEQYQIVTMFLPSASLHSFPLGTQLLDDWFCCCWIWSVSVTNGPISSQFNPIHLPKI